MYDIRKFYEPGQKPRDGDELVLDRRNGGGCGPYHRGEGASLRDSLNSEVAGNPFFTVKVSYAGSSLVISPIL